MAKKEESTQSLLGLATLAQSWNGTCELAVSTGSPSTKTEEHIFAELHKQEYVAAAQAEKTVYAVQKAAEIQKAGSDTFYEVAEHLSALNQAARGQDFERYVTEFNHHNAQVAGKNLLGIVQTGGTRVAEEVNRSLYHDDLPERKRNIVQRLRGD